MSDTKPRTKMPIPFADHIGMELLEIGADRVVAQIIVEPHHCNPMGTMHGGAIMSLADTLGTIGSFRNLPEGSKASTTLESKTNFIGGPRVGDVVIGESTPEHVGKRTSVWTTRVTTKTGKLVAIVTQTQMFI